MFIPINTDAPLYHRPFATFGLIIANCYTFFLTQGGEQHTGWLLTFGNGYHPTEWISSAFLHFGWLHLVGNMFFLYSYGLIVEGKIGSLRYLAIYFFMAACDGMITQTLMLTSDSVGGAGGASGVIFALMAIALLWAPQNEFEVVWVYFPVAMLARTGTNEVSVLFLSGFYFIINFIQATFVSFAISTPVLHLLGAIVGLPVGLLFLKKNWVDCEGWDLLSIWQGKHQPRGLHPSQWKSSSGDDNEDKVPVDRVNGQRMPTVEFIEAAVKQRQLNRATQRYLETRERTGTPPRIRQKTLRKLIQHAQSSKEWKVAITLLQDLISQSPHDINRVRLLLSQIYVIHLQRPKVALRELALIQPKVLSRKERNFAHKLWQQAERLRRQGVLEIAS